MNLEACYRMNYGMYVVSSKSENGEINGQIANTVFQITAEPPTIAISINKQNFTHELIQKSKVFAVSILSTETPMSLIGHFGFKSGREINKFENVVYKLGLTGAPLLLEMTSASLEAEVISTLDVGTHTVFIGKIIASEIISDAQPMTYAYYHKVKRGKSPKTAPTYIDPKLLSPEVKRKKGADSKMKKYECTVCGYIYDPAKGDPESDIPPGTSFKDLPEDWVCPVCGVGKEDFEEEL